MVLIFQTLRQRFWLGALFGFGEMGSKGRVPHLRRPISGRPLIRGGGYGLVPGVRPAHRGAMPPFEILPPPELMEQKLAVQNSEIRKLASENQRLASTHAPLREELAAAQNELQMLHAHIGAVKSEKEIQMRGLRDSITKMEAELKAAEPVTTELQKARAEADQLLASRPELMSKLQQLNQDLHNGRMEAQQIPSLISELDNLRQEYQRCRASYEYEKKLFNDHLESLQVMENNYATMTREVEKLRSQLNTAATADRKGGAYDVVSSVSGKQAPSHPPMYEDDYNAHQLQAYSALPGNSTNAVPASNGGIGVGPPHAPQSGPAWGPNYDPSRGAVYDQTKGYHNYESFYDMHGGHGFNVQAAPASGYEIQRVASYEQQRQPNYGPGGYGYDVPPGFAYEPSSAGAYSAIPRAPALSQVPLMASSADPYGSATPSRHVGTAYEAPPPGSGNATRK